MDYIKLKENEGLYHIDTDYVVLGIGISFDYPNKIKVHKKSGRVIPYTIGRIGIYSTKPADKATYTITPVVVIEDELSIEKFRKQYEE